jgi:F-type H+-transporting ATPase subunit alpha
VISIYAGTNGYFDDIAVPDVAETEREMLRFMREQKSEVRDALIEKAELDDEMVEQLRAALDEFKTQLAAGGLGDDVSEPEAVAPAAAGEDSES